MWSPMIPDLDRRATCTASGLGCGSLPPSKKCSVPSRSRAKQSIRRRDAWWAVTGYAVEALETSQSSTDLEPGKGRGKTISLPPMVSATTSGAVVADDAATF